MIWCVFFQNNTIYEEIEGSGDESSEDNYDSDATTVDENNENNNTGHYIGVEGEV